MQSLRAIALFCLRKMLDDARQKTDDAKVLSRLRCSSDSHTCITMEILTSISHSDLEANLPHCWTTADWLGMCRGSCRWTTMRMKRMKGSRRLSRRCSIGTNPRATCNGDRDHLRPVMTSCSLAIPWTQLTTSTLSWGHLRCSGDYWHR